MSLGWLTWPSWSSWAETWAEKETWKETGKSAANIFELKKRLAREIGLYFMILDCVGGVLLAYWLVRAPVPISGSRGSHGGLGGRSEIATLNRPLLRGRGAAADALDGFSQQLGLPPRASITQKQPLQPLGNRRTVGTRHAALQGRSRPRPFRNTATNYVKLPVSSGSCKFSFSTRSAWPPDSS